MIKIITALFYYLFLKPLSWLPFSLLYRLSDLLYFVFYKMVGYRKKVVVSNLTNSFPEKTPSEITEITKKFYKHLGDLVVESIKGFSISETEIKKRMAFIFSPEIEKDFIKKRSIIIAGGHFNNWELFGIKIKLDIPYETVAIYTSLSNQFFDNKMSETRGKFGLKLVSTKKIKKYLEDNKSAINATIFGFDQSPGNANSGYWLKFLQQDTLMLFGTEKTAIAYNYPIYFGRIHKIKRGFYQYELVKLVDQPIDTNHGDITELLARTLENDIIKNPQYWLWSHKRWKHVREFGMTNEK